jgi:hypothetical protein
LDDAISLLSLPASKMKTSDLWKSIKAFSGIKVNISQIKKLEQQNNNKQFQCFYCNQYYADDIERVTHIDYEHPGRLHYPMPKDFDDRLER